MGLRLGLLLTNPNPLLTNHSGTNLRVISRNGFNRLLGHCLGDDETADSDNESDDACSDDADQQKILKQVNFPPEIERSDVNASSLVTKVSRAIQKRVSRLANHMKTLESIPNKTEVHTKTPNLCLDLSYMVPCVPIIESSHIPLGIFGVLKHLTFWVWLPRTPETMCSALFSFIMQSVLSNLGHRYQT